MQQVITSATIDQFVGDIFLLLARMPYLVTTRFLQAMSLLSTGFEPTPSKRILDAALINFPLPQGRGTKQGRID